MGCFSFSGTFGNWTMSLWHQDSSGGKSGWFSFLSTGSSPPPDATFSWPLDAFVTAMKRKTRKCGEEEEILPEIPRLQGTNRSTVDLTLIGQQLTV